MQPRGPVRPSVASDHPALNKERGGRRPPKLWAAAPGGTKAAPRREGRRTAAGVCAGGAEFTCLYGGRSRVTLMTWLNPGALGCMCGAVGHSWKNAPAAAGAGCTRGGGAAQATGLRSVGVRGWDSGEMRAPLAAGALGGMVQAAGYSGGRQPLSCVVVGSCGGGCVGFGALGGGCSWRVLSAYIHALMG